MADVNSGAAAPVGAAPGWKRRLRRFFSSKWGIGLIVTATLVAVTSGMEFVSDATARAVDRAAQAGRHHGKDKVVARVNDEAIWQSDLNDALPEGVFESTAGQLRQAKLEQLIQQSALRQFLAAHGVHVTQDEVQQAVDEMRRNPPSQGCACCRYPSLAAYLAASSMTIAELRAEIEGKQGLNRYLDRLWQQQYAAPESKTALVAAHRSDAASRYVRAWQIFFNTFQRVNQHTEPAKVDADAHAKADAAWKRLQNGEKFEAVASQVSEDQNSKGKGGDLGTTLKTAYGKEWAAMVGRTQPGEISKPFKSPYGWHIVRWQPMSGDDQVLAIGKQEFASRKSGEIMAQVRKSAHVTYLDGPPARTASR